MAEIARENEGRRPLAFVDTYGCQQNEADSERIRGMLRLMGYEFTEDEFAADLIVVNTCAVREHAEQRVLGNVGALNHTKKAKPDQKIVLCGCMVQQKHMAERVKKSFPIVDLVFGPHELYRFPELMKTMLGRKKRVFAVRETPGEYVEGLPVERSSPLKAWLTVMYGCNNFCSYCVVPYVRGRERSRRAADVIEEARRLVDSGVKDITLLGQNVNSYGHDLDEGHDFAYLIERINAIPGDFVIRFMTSHPKDATERLFRTLADCEKAAKHIHLPFQSGNDEILCAMNRHYTRDAYLRLVDRARELMPGVSLTSDVIVGFPGETDEQFEDTLSLVERVRFDLLFTFIFSPRVGTPAASMPDPFTREQKQARFDRLLELHNAISAQKQAEHVGRVERVLIDGGETGRLTARTGENRLVHIAADKSLIGQFRDVLITDSTTWSLDGKLV
ncbi:MAG: tRNA (N6-isopentenyl adenosine(37)-C2)-methylthiotransferase MiaB [Oscillospiraceae bacterium]|nr:tRNA (N6-isopentenyl adenosine(37)-C2)-methylthiotransferase MiaB [Oscillospiraceae bacterium]